MMDFAPNIQDLRQRLILRQIRRKWAKIAFIFIVGLLFGIGLTFLRK
jgi:hypothetical protein